MILFKFLDVHVVFMFVDVLSAMMLGIAPLSESMTSLPD